MAAAEPASMHDSGVRHDVLCDGKTWTVARLKAGQSKQKGLCFRSGGEVRFLVFSRGALPSDRELESMSEEVLHALLRRAVAQ